MEQVGKSFLGKAAPLIAARGLAAVLTTVIPLVLARMLSLSEFGTYKQLFLVAQTAYYVLPFGVTQSLYYFLPRTDVRRPILMQTLAFLAVVGGLAGVVLFAGSGMVSELLSNPGWQEFRLPLALYVLGVLGSYPLEIHLTSLGKTKASAVAFLGSDLVRCGCMVVPILLGWGLSGLMWAMAGFALCRWALTWVVLYRTSEGPLFDLPGFWRQVLFAAPFGAAMLLAIPQQYAHQYAVSGVFTPEEFALYAVACFQLPLVGLLYAPVSEVLMVRLGELQRQGRLDELAPTFREACAKLSLGLFPVAAFLFAAAPEFICAAFGPRFLPAVPMFRVGVLGITLSVLPVDGVLRATNNTRHIFLSYLCKALVTVPLLYFGVRLFGMAGAMGASAVAECVGVGCLVWALPRVLASPGRPRVRLVELFPAPAFARAGLCAAVSGGAVVLARQYVAVGAGDFWTRLWPLAAVGVAYGGAYLAALFLAGVRPGVLSRGR